MNGQPLINPEDYQLLETKPFKLKDHPANRKFQLINMRLNFGTLPEMIAVSKVPGQNNKFVVQAFVPKKREEPKKIVVPAKDLGIVLPKKKNEGKRT
jgi:hypothetical protein